VQVLIFYKYFFQTAKKLMPLMLQKIGEQPEVLEKTIREEAGKYKKLRLF
jgi:glucosamine 6-phosphate synthetase-like amidotransferase/phosphosugar isomerase protein